MGKLSAVLINNILEITAEHGGGRFFDARDSESLAEALSGILADIKSEDVLFTTSPARASAFNMLLNSEDIYYPMFKLTQDGKWLGNLKKYRIGEDNQIYDANGALAIDPDTGFFKDTAKSFWSSNVDGKMVEAGGMAEKLLSTRPVFTNLSGSQDTPLNIEANHFKETNPAITNSLLGTVNAAKTRKLIHWALGVDVGDENNNGARDDDRKSMGDIIHSQPTPVIYFKDQTSGTVDKTVFVSTNDGFLHSVNDATGVTEFSFIPTDLLGNLKKYRDGIDPGSLAKQYGLDGSMSVWINDLNQDGDVLQDSHGTPDDNEHVYLYLTMRRGGNNIYALDVTRRSSPILKWVIRGGQAGSDFTRLGQTWSTPQLASVKWNGTTQTVLFFAGGYDTAIDGQARIQSNSTGNAVFMVSAATGRLLWKASSSNAHLNVPGMNYSIPADLTLLDLNQSGTIDTIFGADTGGQIFRIDINEENTLASNFASGGIIASLSGGSTRDARRFFEPVTAVVGKDPLYLNIALGSGFRPSPLSTSTRNRVYVIKTPNRPLSQTYFSSNSPLSEASLFDVTSNLIQSGTGEQQASAQAALNNSHGLSSR